MPEITCMQDYSDDWWVEDSSKELAPGRLVWLFYSYMNVIPYEFAAEGRVDEEGQADSTNHNNLSFTIREFRISERTQRTRLPLASFPKNNNEVYLISKAKKRPAVILANDITGFKLIPKLKGGTHWQKQPSLIVAPYYGVEPNAERKGFHPDFVKRVKSCEYPELMYEILPINKKKPKESILYLKHMAAVGRHHETTEPTNYCLSDEAMFFIEEQLKWYFFSEFDSKGLIADVRKAISKKHF